MYEIEKNIPITKNGAGKPCKYPFSKMEVNDSLIFGEYTKHNMSLAANAPRNWAAKANPTWKFVTRKTEDNKIRIWRVE